MPVYLVQHGISLTKDEDPEKGLSKKGFDDTKRIAMVAIGYEVKISRIYHSGKKRAEQTAEAIAEVFDIRDKVYAKDGLKPLDDINPVAEELDSGDNVMLVGHLPFMEKLVSKMVSGQEEKSVFRFQNSGIVCLDNYGKKGDWAIKWALMPEVG